MKFYYFVDKDKNRQGPLPIEDLQAYDITPDTLVFCKGMQGWTKAKDVEELAFLFIPVGESNIQSEENSLNGYQKIEEDDENDETEQEYDDETNSFWDTLRQNKGLIITLAILVFSLILWQSHSTNKEVDSNDVSQTKADTIVVIKENNSSEARVITDKVNAVASETYTQESASDGVMRLSGTIAGADVVMELTVDGSEVSGRYYYAKNSHAWLYLKGYVDDECVTMEEYNADGYNSASYDCNMSLSGNEVFINGSMTNYRGKTYEVYLSGNR